MFKILQFACTAIAALNLVACGGGSPSSPALSATQLNFEATAIKDNYVSFDWNLPTTDVAPSAGTHFFYTNNLSVSSSPFNGTATINRSTRDLTRGLGIPNLTTRSVSRVIKNGQLFATNITSKATWSYQGADVVSTQFATDGITPVSSVVYDEWSAPVALFGKINESATLRSSLGFLRLNTPSNFDFSKAWLADSSYFTRKSFRGGDTLFVFDWTGTTYDTNVNPYGGPETTIESFFNSSALAASNGWITDGTPYKIEDGAIRSQDGIRVWVANTKRPTSRSPTDEFSCLIELNNKLYLGRLQKAGTRMKFIDGVDSTLVLDYSLRLNTKAAESIQQTLKF